MPCFALNHDRIRTIIANESTGPHEVDQLVAPGRMCARPRISAKSPAVICRWLSRRRGTASPLLVEGLVMLKSSKRLEGELRAWANGRSYLFAAHSIQAVSGCHVVARAMSAKHWNEISSDCVGRNDHDWRRYYQSPGAWLRDLLCKELLEEFEIDPQMAEGFIDLIESDPHAIEQVKHFLMAPEFSEVRRAVMEEALKSAAAELEALIADAVNGGPEPVSEEFHERGRLLPAMSFLIRVAFPCVVYFGRLPHDLFRAGTCAECRDLDSLNQLVSVDREIIHLPEVRAILESPDAAKTLDLYMAGASKLLKPLMPPSVLDVKQRAGGFIWQLGKFLGERVTAREIRRLFDLIAQVNDPRHLIDHDFAELEIDSFRRMLARYAEPWEPLLADKTRATGVRGFREGAA
jgi:hypothetical protein